MSAEPPTEDALFEAITELERSLERTISSRRQGEQEITPEHQRVLGVIHESLGELRRLLLRRKRGGASPPDAALERSLSELVKNRWVADLSIPAAWEYALGLQRALLGVGDRFYVRTQLESEWRIETAPDDYVFGRWGRFFERELLEELLARFREGVTEESDEYQQAVECLIHLSVTRNGVGRSLAMNANTRTLYLDRLTKALAGLLLLMLFLAYVVSADARFVFLDVLRELARGREAELERFRLNLGSEGFQHLLVAAALGAAGSLLSGFYTLRDKARRLNDLRSFRAAMWAQPFVGAVAGLLVFLIIRSGITGLTVAVSADAPKDMKWAWATFAVYGFLAGFSEPFFLGLVSRVANTADKDQQGAGGEAPPVQPPPAAGGGRRDAVTSPDGQVFTSPPDAERVTSP